MRSWRAIAASRSLEEPLGLVLPLAGVAGLVGVVLRGRLHPVAVGHVGDGLSKRRVEHDLHRVRWCGLHEVEQVAQLTAVRDRARQVVVEEDAVGRTPDLSRHRDQRDDAGPVERVARRRLREQRDHGVGARDGFAGLLAGDHGDGDVVDPGLPADREPVERDAQRVVRRRARLEPPELVEVADVDDAVAEPAGVGCELGQGLPRPGRVVPHVEVDLGVLEGLRADVVDHAFDVQVGAALEGRRRHRVDGRHEVGGPLQLGAGTGRRGARRRSAEVAGGAGAVVGRSRSNRDGGTRSGRRAAEHEQTCRQSTERGKPPPGAVAGGLSGHHRQTSHGVRAAHSMRTG